MRRAPATAQLRLSVVRHSLLLTSTCVDAHVCTNPAASASPLSSMLTPNTYILSRSCLLLEIMLESSFFVACSSYQLAYFEQRLNVVSLPLCTERQKMRRAQEKRKRILEWQDIEPSKPQSAMKTKADGCSGELLTLCYSQQWERARQFIQQDLCTVCRVRSMRVVRMWHVAEARGVSVRVWRECTGYSWVDLLAFERRIDANVHVEDGRGWHPRSMMAIKLRFDSKADVISCVCVCVPRLCFSRQSLRRRCTRRLWTTNRYSVQSRLATFYVGVCMPSVWQPRVRHAAATTNRQRAQS